MVKVGKPKSKRVPVRLRHKIEKASAAKQRKQRKEAKKNPQWRSRLKKDPGIPNLFPYKEKMLQQIEADKMRKQEDQERRREEAKARREGVAVADTSAAANGAEAESEVGESEEELLDYDIESNEGDEEMQPVDDSSNPMAALLASASARATDFSAAHQSPSNSASSSPEPVTTSQSSSQSHTTAFNNLLSSSDILLYVLDARDPLTTRSRRIEQQITTDPAKRLFLILNKIDLVPPATLRSWLKYLRRSFPTLPLLSTSSSSTNHVRDYSKMHLTPQSTASALMKALKAKSANDNRSITVGVLGYPNTGKSTLINSLLSSLHLQTKHKRSKTAAPTGAEAGVTTALRNIKIDSKLRILDAPGIVFPSEAPPSVASVPVGSKSQEEREKEARLTLLNAVPAHSITDPVPAVALLLSRAAQSSASNTTLERSLAETYNIPPGALGTSDATKSFLIAVARARGRLGKGGVPNLQAAARTVLGDWWSGRIRGGWVEAPVEDNDASMGGTFEGKTAGDEKKIVGEWAEEFKLDGLWGDDAFGDVAVNEEQQMEQ